MNPVISVVLITYNRASLLPRALTSVINQTYPHWEILVVDNHSEDDTDSVVAGYNDNRIRLLKVHNHGVMALSRNLGIREARGEYIAFLDSDDWWTPQKLEESLTYLEKGNDVVYHDLVLVTKPNQRVFWRKVKTRVLKNPAFEDLIANGNGLSNSSVVIRKNTLESIGGLSEDPSLIGTSDYDAWLRVARITEKFERIPQAHGYYWAGGGNISNPALTLKTVDAIEERYLTELVRLDKGGWTAYSKGRSHYQLASYTNAKKHLKVVNQLHPPPLIRLKIYWMLVMIKLREIIGMHS
jgi:glycosyltransferase involved in cell wall biosynthesis